MGLSELHKKVSLPLGNEGLTVEFPQPTDPSRQPAAPAQKRWPSRFQELGYLIDISLVAWSWSWWEYVHHENWRILQIRVPSIPGSVAEHLWALHNFRACPPLRHAIPQRHRHECPTPPHPTDTTCGCSSWGDQGYGPASLWFYAYWLE